MAILPGNPYQTSSRLGSFKPYTDGVFQGMADADAAVQNFLNMGQIDPLATAPLWGGLPIAEQVFQGSPFSSNKAKLTAAVAVAGITGFSVFDQGHHGVITPGPNNVPMFYPGMDLPYYRIGSGARIPVQASSALVALVGGGIKPSVTWNFATGELVPTSAGPSITITGIVMSGSANPFTETVTTATPHSFNVGDTVTQAGFTPSGYNATVEVLSVPTPTTYTAQLTTNPGAVTTAGTVAVAAGTGTLAVTVLGFYANSRIVYSDPVSGNIRWQDGTCAMLQL